MVSLYNVAVAYIYLTTLNQVRVVNMTDASIVSYAPGCSGNVTDGRFLEVGLYNSNWILRSTQMSYAGMGHISIFSSSRYVDRGCSLGQFSESNTLFIPSTIDYFEIVAVSRSTCPPLIRYGGQIPTVCPDGSTCPTSSYNCSNRPYNIQAGGCIKVCGQTTACSFSDSCLIPLGSDGVSGYSSAPSRIRTSDSNVGLRSSMFIPIFLSLLFSDGMTTVVLSSAIVYLALMPNKPYTSISTIGSPNRVDPNSCDVSIQNQHEFTILGNNITHYDFQSFVTIQSSLSLPQSHLEYETPVVNRTCALLEPLFEKLYDSSYDTEFKISYTGNSTVMCDSIQVGSTLLSLSRTKPNLMEGYYGDADEFHKVKIYSDKNVSIVDITLISQTIYKMKQRSTFSCRYTVPVDYVNIIIAILSLSFGLINATKHVGNFRRNSRTTDNSVSVKI